MNKLLFFLNSALLLFLCLGYLAPSIDPKFGSFFPVLSLIFPYLIFANSLFLVFWLLIKPKYAISGAVILFLGWSSVSRHLNIIGTKPNLGDKNEITIVSQNIQAANYFKESKRKIDPEKQKAFNEWIAKKKEVDVFCFQEQRYQANELLNKAFGKWHQNSEAEIGTSIYSKHPIINKGFVEIGGNTKFASWADIKHPEHIFRIYSLHLSSNKISKKTQEIIDEHDLGAVSTYKDLYRVFSKYGRFSSERVKQLQRLNEHIAQCKNPVIIAGDLNDVPQSHVYTKLSKNFGDSFTCAGFGTGASYAGDLPGLRIDYIFYDEQLSCTYHEVLDQKFSDHFAIQSTISVKNSQD